MTDSPSPYTPGQDGVSPGEFDVDGYDAEIERRRRRGMRIALVLGIVVAVVSFLIALMSAII
ncbi:hypothetical protein [Gordonia sp. CPCC 205333]|uniref:hypothetical protein n=1 Tax=Gordonia sp. CPCC 205333 TaxID=3140790 RepID=UPI003AF38244